jgi:uncharacterized protein
VSEPLPSKRRALNFLAQSGCSPGVIRHCKAVAALAIKIAQACKRRGLNVDIQLVEVGALLHDIGRSRTHHVNHAILGAEIARSLNLPDSVVSIIERHVGGGITPDEAKKLGWPVKSYLPRTLEEKIVNYADKLIEGSRRVPIERTIQKFSVQLGGAHPSIKRMKELQNEFSSLIGDFDAKGHPT